MDNSVNSSGANSALLINHRQEAEAYCQYLSAASRGVTRDELLILGLTRELTRLEREPGEQAGESICWDRLLSGSAIGRWLVGLGFLATA